MNEMSLVDDYQPSFEVAGMNCYHADSDVFYNNYYQHPDENLPSLLSIKEFYPVNILPVCDPSSILSVPTVSSSFLPPRKRKQKMKKEIKPEEMKKKKSKKGYTDITFIEDMNHRREFAAFTKGAILLRLEDVDLDSFGQVVWMVDSYLLLQKFIFERFDSSMRYVFSKTERYIGWSADEPWSYYTIQAVLEDDILVVEGIPDRVSVKKHCLNVRKQHPFCREKIQSYEEDETIIKAETSEDFFESKFHCY